MRSALPDAPQSKQAILVTDLGDQLQAEARHLGASQPRWPGACRSTARPRLIISGGETTVHVQNALGRGGRNLEYLLGLAIALDGAPGISALACDTDGIDGTEDAAGAIVVADTLDRARQLGLDPAGHLRTTTPICFSRRSAICGDRPDGHERQRFSRNADQGGGRYRSKLSGENGMMSDAIAASPWSTGHRYPWMLDRPALAGRLPECRRPLILSPSCRPAAGVRPDQHPAGAARLVFFWVYAGGDSSPAGSATASGVRGSFSTA